jgi:hypothetical protein
MYLTLRQVAHSSVLPCQPLCVEAVAVGWDEGVNAEALASTVVEGE